MKTPPHRHFLQIRAWLMALSLALPFATAHASGGTRGPGLAGESLLPLRTGTAGPFSYGLFNLKGRPPAASDAPAGFNLVLVLRNIGGRWVNFPEIASQDFTLKDARGKALKLELKSPPQPIIFGDVTVLQIFVPGTAAETAPWTLRFKSNVTAKVPFDISIPGIKP